MGRFFSWVVALVPGVVLAVLGLWLTIYAPMTTADRTNAWHLTLGIAAVVLVAGLVNAALQGRREDAQAAGTAKDRRVQRDRHLHDLRRRGWELYKEIEDLVLPVRVALYSIRNDEAVRTDLGAAKERMGQVREYYSQKITAESRFHHDYEIPLALLIEETHAYVDSKPLRQQVHLGMNIENIDTVKSEFVDLLHKLENVLWEKPLGV